MTARVLANRILSINRGRVRRTLKLGRGCPPIECNSCVQPNNMAVPRNGGCTLEVELHSMPPRFGEESK